MALELSKLNGLLEGRENPTLVGFAPPICQKYLGAYRNEIYLSRQTLEKILNKHNDIKMFDMLILTRMLCEGCWIGDRPNECCVLYYWEDQNKYFRAPVKITKNREELYITSFYRVREKQIHGLMSKANVLTKQIKKRG